MFGKKKQSTPLGQAAQQEQKDEVMISSIPDAFYGGKNPVVYQAPETVPSPLPEQKDEPAPMQQLAKPTGAAAPTVASRAAYTGRGRWVILIVVGMLLLLSISVGSVWFFYLRDTTPAPAEPAPRPQPTEPTEPVEPTPTTPTEPTTPALPAIPTTTEPAIPDGPVIEFPQVFLIDSADIDADKITDIEEEYYATDSGTWDTDGDGYYDGQEIQYLYSPTDSAPTLLIDAGTVREYVNPQHGYRLYHPISWEVASVDTNGDQLLISALTGDYVEIVRSEKQLPAEPFTAWFAREAIGQRITDIVEFTNQFDVTGWHRQDSLVAYFDTPEAVYVFVYHPGTTGSIPFRQTMTMMYQSFRPSQMAAVIPTQVVLPSVSTRTSTQAEDIPTSTSETTSTSTVVQ